ncbi:hypothetical protein LAZ67_21002706 [Cordylochernes scorpioides]|uniref:Uncharacterized protein n=1 Tax=Cordylochernes scorpioides TaxID=51811 RepID=A0ABY6LMZ8_9ARAC|nr:hypothetical protein LAZ67_21002706 [Cordylochernes scorpioides]
MSMMEFCTLLKWEVMCAERVLVLVLCGLLVTVDAVRHTCPPDNLVSPCTCDGEGINCKKVGNDQGLKTALDRIGGGNYRGFWVQNANLRVLKASMFQKYKIGNFYLEVNNITEVQPGTFTGSEDVVQGISIFGNKLTTFPFTDLKTMKNLMRINIGRNQITDIPAFALSDHPRLSTIILAENQINSIGINAFQNLPMLQRLDLTKNALTVLGRYSLNINVHHPALQNVSQPSYMVFFFLISTLGEVDTSAFVIKTGSTTQWQADLAAKKMAASDMRNRRHVQPLLTWSTNAAHPVSLDQEPLQSTMSRAS